MNFFSTFHHQVYDVPHENGLNIFCNDNLGRLTLTENEVMDVMFFLNTSKSTGVDELPPIFFRNCASVLIPSITKMFNLFLNIGKVPFEWNSANITPIFKKGLHNKVENYRPVSIVSVISKILERCVFEHIYLIAKNLININQHGFMEKRITVLNLLEFYDKAYNSMDRNKQFDELYLDFMKAFDSVPHTLLMYKIKTFGFDNNKLLEEDRELLLMVLILSLSKLCQVYPRGPFLDPCCSCTM